ncbi:MAG: hypothetical protein IJH63_10465 [Methanobrevibacter sp.]|nr:hypothetical protein [Methanosphaera sp.]MBR0371123.1 hypothetical protein [Methanobrevibacter sp.]
MGIKVISQSTSEREAETKELFEEIKPLLDNHLTYSDAVCQVKNIKDKYLIYQRAWFKDLIKYGETKGYPYIRHSGKSLFNKNGEEI